VAVRSILKGACSATIKKLGLSEFVGIPGIKSVVVEKFRCTTWSWELSDEYDVKGGGDLSPAGIFLESEAIQPVGVYSL
jgi:hypothetical protein